MKTVIALPRLGSPCLGFSSPNLYHLEAPGMAQSPQSWSPCQPHLPAGPGPRSPPAAQVPIDVDLRFLPTAEQLPTHPPAVGAANNQLDHGPLSEVKRARGSSLKGSRGPRSRPRRRPEHRAPSHRRHRICHLPAPLAICASVYVAGWPARPWPALPTAPGSNEPPGQHARQRLPILRVLAEERVQRASRRVPPTAPGDTSPHHECRDTRTAAHLRRGRRGRRRRWRGIHAEQLRQFARQIHDPSHP
jgi:hypothetical protein